MVLMPSFPPAGACPPITCGQRMTSARVIDCWVWDDLREVFNSTSRGRADFLVLILGRQSSVNSF